MTTAAVLGYGGLPRLLGRLTGDEKHDPSSHSTLDVLWVLYDRILRVEAAAPDDPDRDRFLLSKGHGPAAYYAVLAAKGFFPEEWLDDFGSFASPLGYHPDGALVPGVEIASGSLGHGLGDRRRNRARGTAGLLPRRRRRAGRGQQLGGDPVRRPDRARAADGRRGRQLERDPRLAGRNRGPLPDRGLDGRARRRSRPRRARASLPGGRRRPPAPRRRRGAPMRARFYELAAQAVEDDPRVAIVLADIGAGVLPRHDRIFNLGIREQLMIGVAAGLAREGYRPVAHSYAPFLVERPYEQIKLDLGHQDVGAVLVSVGASYDAATAGRTHQSTADVALLSALPGWTIHVPGHPDELERAFRAALAEDGRVYIRMSEERNAAPVEGDGLVVLREGNGPLVVAVGPTLDPVLAATADLDATVAYLSTVRPFDAAGLRAALTGTDIVLVEPYQAGTSAAAVADALADRPFRLLALGVRHPELRRYGTGAEHRAVHGLDARGIRTAVECWSTRLDAAA
jgi:transketolase